MDLELKMTQTHPLELQADGGIAVLTLQHPSRPNALSEHLQRALLDTLAQIGQDDRIRVLILTARGSTFCVGADLQALQGIRAEGGSVAQWTCECLERWINPIVLALRALKIPTVCALNGAAAGAGVGLALAADLLLMAQEAYLYLPFASRLGLIPDMGSSWFLLRQIGRARTMALALLGDRLDAQQAVAWGLAIEAVPAAMLAERAQDYARRLAKLPPGIALRTREIIGDAERNTLEQQLASERRTQYELLSSPACEEGIQAFLEKREPRFWTDEASQARAA